MSDDEVLDYFPQDHPDVRLVPPAEVIRPTAGILECILNAWWAAHPDGRLIFFRRGRENLPQCNTNRKLAEQMTAKLYPWATIVFVPVAFRRVNLTALNRQALPRSLHSGPPPGYVN